MFSLKSPKTLRIAEMTDFCFMFCVSTKREIFPLFFSPRAPVSLSLLPSWTENNSLSPLLTPLSRLNPPSCPPPPPPRSPHQLVQFVGRDLNEALCTGGEREREKQERKGTKRWCCERLARSNMYRTCIIHSAHGSNSQHYERQE